MKKFSFPLLIIVTIFAIAGIDACQSSKSSAGKTLQFNLQKGKSYDYEMVLDADQTIMGQKSKTSMMTGYSLDVMQDDGQVKTLSFMFKDFKMDMNIMGMELHVDSEKPGPALTSEDIKANPLGAMSKIFSGIINKKFMMDVNKEGEVIKVSGVDEIAMSLADSLGLDPATRDKMMQSAKQQFNNDDIKDQFMQIFFIFPGKEVKVGDSWEKTYETKGKMPGKNISTYTVKEIEGNHVTLDVVTKILSTSDVIKIEGENRGVMIVDSQSGLIVNADLTMEMEVSTNGMTIKMNGKSRVKGKERN